MRLIAYWISLIIKEFARINLPEDKDKRKELLQNFSKQLEKSSLIKKIKLKVKKLSSKFPIPNI
jgi:hypothetical protein